ncbi:KEOPS complex subunit Cgi121 [Halococcus saccharolyticus]|uniref:KEOPS complex Cgi121-like subunit n=1 Tax=Halococcus saccharolyticus DSM 5350 TaxID=1227455 RepID=M0MAM0_9EURY|nr:KEOPS complex subunit Cgi121 [Halococcus saccharolyticus]EMA42837.1 KEOPS complex Cgi121-like subunit [Halococcus saccharolyticus DSM 5350]
MELVDGRVTIKDIDRFVAELTAIGEEHGCAIQAFDARYIVSRGHLERALELADRARARGEAVARERAVEILLYAAGRRQIERAFELGIDAGEGPVVVLVAAEEDGETNDERAAAAAVGELLDTAAVLGEDDTLDGFDEVQVCEFFGIGDAELAATHAGLDALVGERVALLDVEK